MICTLSVIAPDRARAAYTDILSQAVTGELVGMLNYASMARLFDAPAQQLEAVGHAAEERRHVLAFRGVARKLGVRLIEDPAAPFWRRIRDAFERLVQAGDVLSCVVVQDLMLESFAVALYRGVTEVPEQCVAQAFAAIADEEEEHLAGAIEALRPELDRDYGGFEARLERLHLEIMTVLAQMLAGGDAFGRCGLCAGACVKESLGCVGLGRAALRGQAVRTYLESLNALGVRGEKSLEWIANLPA